MVTALMSKAILATRFDIRSMHDNVLYIVTMRFRRCVHVRIPRPILFREGSSQTFSQVQQASPHPPLHFCAAALADCNHDCDRYRQR